MGRRECSLMVKWVCDSCGLEISVAGDDRGSENKN
jgi:hypothetical protein